MSESSAITAEAIRVDVAEGGRTASILALERFRPAPGAVTVVTGPSGSGKSTLLYMLAGLLPPSAGHIRHHGDDIYALSEPRRDLWRRRTIGFVFQDFHLIPDLSVLANVMLPASFGSGGAAARSRGRDLLKSLGVPLDRKSIDVLSRGERQRVAIARALAYDPAIVLADEPTASLDDRSGAEVQAILARLAGEGRTVIVASHDRRFVDGATAILRLDHGRATGVAA